MAVTTIRLRRGNKPGLPLLGAISGEPLFCMDTKELFVGMGTITQAQYNSGVRPSWASYGILEIPEHQHGASQIIEETDLRFVNDLEKDALSGIDYNIKDRIDSLTSGLVWKGIAATFADIALSLDFPVQGWAVIVEADETHSGQRSMYVYDEAVVDWVYAGAFNITASAIIDDTRALLDKTYSSNFVDAALAFKSSLDHSHDGTYAKISDLDGKANVFEETLLHDKSTLGSMTLDESNKGQGRTLLYDQTNNTLNFVDSPASARISDGTISGGTVWSSDKVNAELLKKSDKTHEHLDTYKSEEVDALLSDFYNKETVDSKIEAAQSSVVGLKKEIVFVIPKVTVGVQKVEIALPYKGKIATLFANLPSDTVLTNAVVADLEVLIANVWTRVDSIAILPGQVSATKTVNSYVVDNYVFRVHIISTPPTVIPGLSIVASVEID